MNDERTKAWILSAAVALNVAGFAPSPAGAAPREHDEALRLSDAPREVRESVERERGRREVTAVRHVIRDGRESYRVTFADRGGSRAGVVRFGADGRVLGWSDDAGGGGGDAEEREVRLPNVPRDVRETIERERGHRDVRAIYEVRRVAYYWVLVDERGADRLIRVAEDGRVLGERDVPDAGGGRPGGGGGGPVRRGVDDDGEHVEFDRLPGEVKTAIAREAGSDKVGHVHRYDRRNGAVYEAEITGGGRERTVRVNQAGRVIGETDETPEGRRAVRFNELPGAVKSGIASQAPENKIARVVQVTRDGKTWYRARVEEAGREAYWITVDEGGRQSRDFDRGR